jgi:hypothetical protein
VYVLKHTAPGPDYFEEHFYDETVSVKNHIALVIKEHVRDALLGPAMGYELIGVIEDSNDLEKFLTKLKNKEERNQVGMEVRKNVMKIEDILAPEDPTEEEQTKAWIDSIE